eukprot:1152131-Pelagomonas_calceolata.AAC.7
MQLLSVSAHTAWLKKPFGLQQQRAANCALHLHVLQALTAYGAVSRGLLTSRQSHTQLRCLDAGRKWNK